VAIAPSIANAVAHALGGGIEVSKDVNKIPLTPDYIYSIIKKHNLLKK